MTEPRLQVFLSPCINIPFHIAYKHSLKQEYLVMMRIMESKTIQNIIIIGVVTVAVIGVVAGALYGSTIGEEKLYQIEKAALKKKEEDHKQFLLGILRHYSNIKTACLGTNGDSKTEPVIIVYVYQTQDQEEGWYVIEGEWTNVWLNNGTSLYVEYGEIKYTKVTPDVEGLTCYMK